MAQNIARFEWFQISPTSSNEEERQRCGQFLHHFVLPFIHKNIGYYGGGNPASLAARFKEFKENKEKAGRPCVIAISCHGRPRDAFFLDKSNAETFWWTPQRLWNGLKYRYGTNNQHVAVVDGFKNILQNHPFSRVTFLCTQCYGANFADSLRNLVTASDCVNISVEGLSYGKTFRSTNKNPSATIDNYVFHKQTLVWLQSQGSSPLKADAEDDNTDGVHKTLLETEETVLIEDY